VELLRVVVVVVVVPLLLLVVGFPPALRVARGPWKTGSLRRSSRSRRYAVTPARASTSEDISAKAPMTRTGTLESHDLISLVMGPSAPSGVPGLRSNSSARWRYSRETSSWRASTGLPGRAYWGPPAEVFKSAICLSPVRFPMAMPCAHSGSAQWSTTRKRRGLPHGSPSAPRGPCRRY
jgi:hypothetical protein